MISSCALEPDGRREDPEAPEPPYGPLRWSSWFWVVSDFPNLPAGTREGCGLRLSGGIALPCAGSGGGIIKGGTTQAGTGGGAITGGATAAGGGAIALPKAAAVAAPTLVSVAIEATPTEPPTELDLDVGLLLGSGAAPTAAADEAVDPDACPRCSPRCRSLP